MTTDNLPAIVESNLLTKEGLASSAAQLHLLEDYVRSVLREGQDYGVIPGTGAKPTLLKPGAANVIAAFNCYPEPHTETETIDLDRGLIFYRVRVDVLRMDNGQRRATGQGSCSSYEKKYRYRNALAVCPVCKRENIRVSKGGGFYCWQKLGGCGGSFRHDDERITAQTVGQVINEDPMEQANTILKMAIKRAEVDAALRLPGVARFFTKDLEDMQGAGPEPQSTAAEQSDALADIRQVVKTSEATIRQAAAAEPKPAGVSNAQVAATAKLKTIYKDGPTAIAWIRDEFPALRDVKIDKWGPEWWGRINERLDSTPGGQSELKEG